MRLTHCVEHFSLATHLSPFTVGCATSLGWGSIQGKDEAPAFRLRLLVHLTVLSAVLPTHARPCRVPWGICFSSPLAEMHLYQQPEIRLPATEVCIRDPNMSQAHSCLISKQPLEWGYPQFMEEMEAWLKKYAHTVCGGACL